MRNQLSSDLRRRQIELAWNAMVRDGQQLSPDILNTGKGLGYDVDGPLSQYGVHVYYKGGGVWLPANTNVWWRWVRLEALADELRFRYARIRPETSLGTPQEIKTAVRTVIPEYTTKVRVAKQHDAVWHITAQKHVVFVGFRPVEWYRAKRASKIESERVLDDEEMPLDMEDGLW